MVHAHRSSSMASDHRAVLDVVVRDTAVELLERDNELGAGEVRTQTAVGPRSERQMAI
jgi:hypothetical protein